jgi:hypothetical protein
MKLAKTTQKLAEWSSTCTFHCFPKIFLYEHVVFKIVWTVNFLCFSCLTIWLVSKCLLDYLEFDVVTKIRAVSEKDAIFPTVTICDANTFPSKGVLVDQYFLNPDKTNSKNLMQLTLDNMDMNAKYGSEQTFYLNETQRQESGFYFKTLFQSCKFGQELCDLSDFNWIFTFLRGNCYQFNANSSNLKKVKTTGFQYGLRLFLGPFSYSQKPVTYYAEGLRIYIHNNSFLSPSVEQIFVERGKYTSISIKKVLTYKTPWPYSECSEYIDSGSSSARSDFYDFLKQSNSEYRQKDCIEVCLQNIIIADCKCFYTRYPILKNNIIPCFNSTQVKCTDVHTITLKNEEIEKKCSLECPLECEYSSYEVTSSSLDYPSREFFEALNNYSIQNELSFNYTDLNEFKRNHLGLNIYLSSMEFTELREKPQISFIDLVSNMGGALGIFLGFSIFSFIEMLEIFVQILFIITNSVRK